MRAPHNWWPVLVEMVSFIEIRRRQSQLVCRKPAAVGPYYDMRCERFEYKKNDSHSLSGGAIDCHTSLVSRSKSEGSTLPPLCNPYLTACSSRDLINRFSTV